mgnify:CR=1 FL=1
MPNYYVNNNQQESQDGRHHEVHEEGCEWLKKAKNKTFLGWFFSCKSAMIEARKKYPHTADGCYFCCKECNLESKPKW